jgi:hypothetical protein
MKYRSYYWRPCCDFIIEDAIVTVKWRAPIKGLFRYFDDLVQAFLKKWWVESDFKAPNLLLSLRFKGSGCHYNITLICIEIEKKKVKQCSPTITWTSTKRTTHNSFDKNNHLYDQWSSMNPIKIRGPVKCEMKRESKRNEIYQNET